MEIEKSNNGGSNPSAGEEFKDMIKGVTKFLMMVIFLGTIMLWIMMPTLTYRTKWLPHLRIKFGTSTYFGATGTTLFMYMFPMMVVACLGCVYLHFKNRKSPHHIDRETKGGVWSKLRKPMLVKGPLGIVSVTEITFLAMFVALLLWCFITYLRNSFATITPKSAAAHDESLWQAKLESAALRLGLIGNICLAFLFLPVARGSSLLPAMGLTSESSIKYHIWLGHMVMALFTVHGLCYIIYWASMHEISQMIMWDTKGVSNLAGEIALAAGLVMWATTYPKIRRRFFEVFFYTHYLYIVFMLFFVLHVGISFSFIALPGFYIFLVDRFLRFLQSRENVRLLAARILPSDTMELTFSKNSKLVYSPTSIMFVNIPSISKLQWHPFTITSSSKLEPEKLSIVIKKEGKWSTKLHQRLSSSDQIDRLAVSVEGPYGPASADFLRHEALVMVCGGSGITPFISVIRDLIATSQKETCKIPKITLICAFKKSSEISMLDLVLPLSGLETELSSDINIKIEAFITRDNDAGDEAKAGKIKTLWFKPSLSDQSISSILGPNSWLWLGAILASSFLIFMIIIGIITRYYIYPIDHNTNKIYSLTSKTIIYILVISVSIMATCSAAMLWNKKKYGKVESKQVQNVDRPSPTSSPTSSWGYNSLREIESTPQESLVQRTNLHFGERPNLKKLLLDVEGSSVGVLVCGPKKMRQKVAEICSSGLAENLHFESISFSW
ncbi:Riboflavin synthase-like beta-barrel [Arabidopsis thaliana x Arabidopsis arenosa]|jgi:predicted ferric reductase|uniref:Ferric reduction oxidase 2 n=6 Tax=Arabidopsis TaxID=3701 RepID=FRO2_ARATH|nr:ferric reduction oxidase 2 [Arabidopsis thaliana]P92949.2 RecName: Full=Ferric reduction oxidase 2; Short=AtFRO2; AltName: Full=Ferric-chelate reductase 2; AltName: Full=Protein FERRIC CHELATE REDUCTASE DEFECTIVE 1 [Arabidopsis thaliana]KAG7644707.1 Riboflavin synthase-like beta-barrel [Arabidopsis thaliana x Arabidopsis arenosa]AAP51420.1 ferric-chelate reductase [Arabidopsis thaliana]AEE27308.1 ferric reduction oxidase 2 [Arabidopsis thaliana]OAP19467.1 FRO2 [Arabidopsis thaliana]CAA7077|eukprot:NP_171664.1 ferric reduction oxidase 2 [Arabidopsis thaliana]